MIAPVVVVGTGAAGLTVAEALRREGYDGRLVLIGEENHLPYDRPPLSKGVLLGAVETSRLALRAPAVIEALDADLLLGRRAKGLDIGQRIVTLEDGTALGYGTLVIATGVRARRLPAASPGATVHTVRTIEDTLALAEDLVDADSVVVIGGGLLGYELAATTRMLGLEVTLLDRSVRPLVRMLGPDVGAMLATIHAERGVGVRTAAAVSRIASHPHGIQVVDRGTPMHASVVIAAVGSVTNTEWLRGSRLRVDDGVVCDRNGRAAADVYAVGDVARWADDDGDGERIEHRTSASEQAMAVARSIMQGDERPRPPRYFWTDQFDIKVQVAGAVDGSSTFMIAEGEIAAGRFVALTRSSGGRGVIGWRMPREFAKHRAALASEQWGA
ncbi:NAD(P)/FAD-dependent oxidoreductase [Microbacterium abyssi]|uniref:NAD(P)/FAD-dependent oxidoreductase n=1 Tax=Microbacterium abyssi TaxID=2782166 RepID=UPI001889944D|nr:FAD-dependent oxidoreductase [Microbacterium sp. A18JL241]